MGKHQIAETATFDKKITDIKYAPLYGKITNYVYPLLRENPFYGQHIKKLKGK